MVAALPGWAADLLQFWFGELDRKDWFRSSERVDRALRDRFAGVLDEEAGRPASAFLASPRLAQAAILLFDQVPRNIYRDEAKAYAHDALARAIARQFIARGWDDALPDRERQFVAMPLMHSEDIADQEASLAYFAEHLPGNMEFARSHHAMIERFGRFPHRNPILERESTAAERAAVKEGFAW